MDQSLLQRLLKELKESLERLKRNSTRMLRWRGPRTPRGRLGFKGLKQIVLSRDTIASSIRVAHVGVNCLVFLSLPMVLDGVFSSTG
ncbi:hypothetical protein FNV43_RR12162 [Rhamnella rubrinervis]|uniref:Uncharacterized protein n=1 Tax=Rhamnella rubrinervis TaxID=2594499 RepID=A0A8K0H706_9ROSA|nr:hypothetical protein FNV43_RR12162 [Rhamnella rubrinervis]